MPLPIGPRLRFLLYGDPAPRSLPTATTCPVFSVRALRHSVCSSLELSRMRTAHLRPGRWAAPPTTWASPGPAPPGQPAPGPPSWPLGLTTPSPVKAPSRPQGVREAARRAWCSGHLCP